MSLVCCILKEALAKYGEVLGQIECVKDLQEQVKKIQAEVKDIFSENLPFKNDAFFVFSQVKIKSV